MADPSSPSELVIDLAAEPVLLPGVAAVGIAATAAAARRALRATGCRAAVVVDHGEPVGIVTLDLLDERLAAGALPGDAPVEHALSYECVRVDRPTDEADIVSRFRSAAWRHLRRRPVPVAPGATDDAEPETVTHWFG